MGSKGVTCTGAFFLCVNLILFSMVSSITPVPSPPSPPLPPNCTLQVALCLALHSGLRKSILPLPGSPPSTDCCTLVAGLVDLEAAVCLCAAIKADVLGIKVQVPADLTVNLNQCGRNVTNYRCN